MIKSSHSYVEEDWLIHTHYGIGRIKGVEEKSISGATVRYFKVQTADSQFWIPVDQIDGEMMRPLSTLEEIQLVIAILQRPPQAMPSDYKIRKDHIRRVQLENSPVGIARLVRDYRARQRIKNDLNLDERNTIRALKDRLVEEWSIITGKNIEQVASGIDDLLDHYQISTQA